VLQHKWERALHSVRKTHYYLWGWGTVCELRKGIVGGNAPLLLCTQKAKQMHLSRVPPRQHCLKELGEEVKKERNTGQDPDKGWWRKV